MDGDRDGGMRITAGLAEKLARAANAQEAVLLARDGLGLDHVTYYFALRHARLVVLPFVKSTYPERWLARYLLRDYLNVDPVIREGSHATQAFDWQELEWSERERAFLADAVAHGLGDKGYTIPVFDRFARRALLTLNSSMSTAAWEAFIAINAPELPVIAQAIHDKALAELSDIIPAAPALAPREIECLLWTARGKEAKAIAAILDISEYTVRSYLRTARQKLECRTLSQAVAKAMRDGMIDP